MNNETMELLEEHFDIAFAAPDNIKKLRELILPSLRHAGQAGTARFAHCCLFRAHLSECTEAWRVAPLSVRR